MKLKSKMLTVMGLSAALTGLTAQLATAGEDHKSAAKVGEAAPMFTLKDTAGADVKLADSAGKIVVLEWVNPECPVCKGAHKDGRIPNMVKELQGMEGVQFLAINSTATTDAQKNIDALKAYGVEYTVLLDNDGTVGHMYGAKTTPHVFVIDDKGVLRYEGALDNNEKGDKSGAAYQNYVLSTVKQIKAGETVSPEHTKAYGCSVKYAKKDKPAGGSEHPKGSEHPGS